MRRLLLDTDPGLDDALALLVALRAAGARVEGVTTVAGNVALEAATLNVARVLGVARPAPPPPVAPGAPGPLVGRPVRAYHVHGEDGLGGLGDARGPDGAPRYPPAPLHRHPGDAADLILACARRDAASLTLVALGPLTNLALAAERDAAAVRAVGRVVAMAGAIAVGGNVTAAAEFNAFADPEAAARVLAAGLRLTLVPLDVTRRVAWTAARLARLGPPRDAVAGFAADLAARGLARAASAGEDAFTLHDPLAVAVALWPDLVETEELPVAVETEGRLTRGATVADRRRRAAGTGTRCRVALEVDAGRALRVVEEALWGTSA